MLRRRRSSEEIRVSVFSNDLMTSNAWGRQGLDYIALRVQHEPLDQADLSNGLDASSKAVGDRHTKLADRWAHGVPRGLIVGLGGPTCHPLALGFGDVASGVFYSLST